MNRRKYLVIAAVLITILGAFFLITFQKSKTPEKKDNYEVKLTDNIDPDIVLINLEEGDRSFIGNLLLKIDSCNPKLIAIDGWFENEKDSTQDSVLMHALKNIQKDILGYSFDSTDKPIYSHSKFISLVSGNGSIETLFDKELAVGFIPLETSEDHVYEHFTL